MCTVVTLWRPGHPWPLCLAANRDERLDRPWDAPGAHWPGQPDVIGGRDRLGGGTWMAVNGHGVIACVLNRVGTLGPAPGKRSRGELPLISLRKTCAIDAADAVAELDAGLYRDFNLVLADRAGVVFVRGLGEGRPEIIPLDPGTHMVTACDPDAPGSKRTKLHLPKFAATAPTAPDAPEWQALQADRTGPAGGELNVPPRGRFGTVCAAIVSVAQDGGFSFLFAGGAPDLVPFTPIGRPIAA